MPQRSLLTLFLFVSFNVFGQAPGYQGKTLWISYNPHFIPSIVHIDAPESADLSIVDYLLPQFDHHINLEYITGPGFAIGASGSYAKFKNIYSTGAKVVSVNSSYYYTYYEYDEYTYESPYTAFSGAFYIKIYRHKAKGAIAPYGNYNQFTLGVVKGSVSHFLHHKNKSDEEIMQLYFSYTFGKQHILFDRIILGYGLQIGVPFATIDRTFRPEEPISVNNRDITLLTLGQKVINFNMNVGVLLF